jgi:hypothetical protein
MNDLQRLRLEMLRRARVFGEQHSADFAAQSRGRRGFATVNQVVERAGTLSSQQESGGGTSGLAVAVLAVREDLEAINDTAAAMAEEMPELEGKFRMPRSNGAQAVLDAARVFAADALPLKETFIEFGLPGDFLDDLGSDIAALETGIASRQAGQIEQVGVTAELDEVLDEGAKAVRQLDAIVGNRYRNDSAGVLSFVHHGGHRGWQEVFWLHAVL